MLPSLELEHRSLSNRLNGAALSSGRSFGFYFYYYYFAR